MSIDNLKDLEKIEKLRRLKFIGDFPKGIEVLLVPLETALEELRLEDSSLTNSILKSILLKKDIFIFSNIEQWNKYKGIKGNK